MNLRFLLECYDKEIALLYKAVFGQELLYSPEIPKMQDLISSLGQFSTNNSFYFTHDLMCKYGNIKA